MALNWITEPSDYSGAVGHTMPVVAEVGGFPAYRKYGVDIGGDPFSNGDWQTVSGAVSYLDNSLYCGNATQGASRSRLGNVAISRSTVYSSRSEFEGGSYGSYYIFRSDDNNQRVSIAHIGNDFYISNMQNGVFTDTILYVGALQVGYYVDSTVSFTATDIVMDITYRTSGGTILYSGVTVLPFTIDVSQMLPTCFSFQTGMRYSRIEIGTTTTFTLRDHTGTIRDIQVSSDGLYSYDALNLQPRDTGTWTLEAENAGDTIISPFEVLIQGEGTGYGYEHPYGNEQPYGGIVDDTPDPEPTAVELATSLLISQYREEYRN